MNKAQLKIYFAEVAPDLSRRYKRYVEKRKFQNPQRQAIAEKFLLTAEQKAQIDCFFMTNYGEKINYVWHQNFAAHAGRFDYRFFPELLFIPEFEAYQNNRKEAIAAFSDKNLLPLIAQAVGVKMPHTIVSCTHGVLRDCENHIITSAMADELVKREGVGFVKPTVDSCSGENCRKIHKDDILTFCRNKLIINEINGIRGGYRQDFVIQRLLVCHETIQALYAGSVNSFRVITYFWKGQVEVMPLIIRIGQGGHYLDNAHQGGMFCAVCDDGTMGNHAVTEFNDQFKEHPDTHVVFATHRIAHVNKVITAAKRMHAAIPQLGVVNWDFTVDEGGEAVLIEANCANGSVWLPQMAHGIGAFGERTAEVLQWLRFMKRLKPSERERFVGGWME